MSVRSNVGLISMIALEQACARLEGADPARIERSVGRIA